MEENIADKNIYQASLFANRLSKRYKILRKWARRERVSCYRLYDRDIPEVPLAADLYEFLPSDAESKLEAARFMHEQEARYAANDPHVESESSSRRYLTLYLYERPYDKPDDEEEKWLSAMADAAATTLNIDRSHVMTKMRRHDKGGSQYSKDGRKHDLTARHSDSSRNYDDAPSPSAHALTGIVQEQGQIFRVNLTDYLDSGLFFDHRILRSLIRDTSSGKSVLNLFCYTGSFSVYAAEGKAARVESVDLSNTYLSWAKDNFNLNDFNDSEKYIFTKQDVTGFLNQKLAEVPHKDSKGNNDGTNRYDIIILDPPTFSNSKSTENTLDINRDWNTLVTKCLNLLASGGVLYFSTNSRRLSFDRALIPQATDSGAVISVTDMTEESLSEDYKETKIHRLWKFQIGKIQL